MSLLKNQLQPLAKNVLIPLGLTAAASSVDAGIDKNNLKVWNNTSNMKRRNNRHYDIVKSLEDSGLLLKGVTATMENETKEQSGVSLGKIWGTLGASLLGNVLSDKEVIRAGDDVLGLKMELTLLWRRSLSYRNQFIDLLWKSIDWFLYDRDPRHERIKTKRIFNDASFFDHQNKSNFKCVYSRNIPPNTMKDETYLANLDGYKSIGTHWVALYMNVNRNIFWLLWF